MQYIAYPLFLFGVLYGFGYWQLNQLPDYKTLDMVAVQPNVQPTNQSRASHNALRDAARYTEKFFKHDAGAADLVIWPEMPIAMSYSERSNDRALVDSVYRRIQSPLLLNGYQYIDAEKTGYTNTTYLVSGNQVSEYDKQILIPFGEYLPQPFSFLKSWVPNVKKYVIGENAGLLPLQDQWLATPVCYEMIFPNYVRRQVVEGADILINAGDDIWFYSPQAMHIHFTLATFRAIENRISIVRVFNNGITALIKPSGEIDDQKGTFDQQFIYRYSVPIKSGNSFYTLYGYWIWYVFLLIALVLIVMAVRKYRLSPRSI